MKQARSTLSSASIVITLAAILLLILHEVSQAEDVKSLEGTHLRKISTWSDSTQRIERFRYRDGLIYAINGFSFQVLDVRDWQNPTLLSELPLPRVMSDNGLTTPTGFIDFEIVEQRAYIVQSRVVYYIGEGFKGMRPAKVIDISSPAHPSELPDTPMDVMGIRYNNRFATISEWDALVFLTSDEVGNLEEQSRIPLSELRFGIPTGEIVLSDTHAFPSWDASPRAIDLSDLEKPEHLGSLDLHGGLYARSNILFSTGETSIHGPLRLDTWLFANSTDLVLKDSVVLSDTKTVSRPYVHRDVLYCFRDLRNVDGRVLTAYDVSNVENIREMGTLTFPSSRATGRSKWIAPADDHLIVAIDGELHIYEILRSLIQDTFAQAYETWSDSALPNVSSAYRLPEADPDNDGSSNIIEMATGANPLNADTPLNISRNDDGKPAITFSRPQAFEGLFDYTIEVSGDLSIDSWETLSSEGQATETAGVRYLTIQLPASSPFTRLRINVKPQTN